MSETEFKVGDRVVLIEETAGFEGRTGDEGTVTAVRRIDSDAVELTIEADAGYKYWTWADGWVIERLSA